jgi:hypothetical protein
MATKKCISDINDKMELVKLLKQLGVSYRGRQLNLEDMKKQAKEKIQEHCSDGATVKFFMQFTYGGN